MGRKQLVTEVNSSKITLQVFSWTDIFNTFLFEFEPVDIQVISYDNGKAISYRSRTRKTYEMSKKDVLNIKSSELDLKCFRTLGVILHEMCHIWQKTYGTPSKSWLHNKEFRTKMTIMGIECNEKGQNIRFSNPFLSVLSKYGISIEGANKESGTKTRLHKNQGPKSKLKKWTCGCTNVRVAVSYFDAVCSRCGNAFKIVQ